mmetsp:Transcript_29500/g.73564  ORF Transcript_29500/g.73564 Transcript_29500/m.73564 type:complete len:213 (+) Transcript_29500:1358-1996(+)
MSAARRASDEPYSPAAALAFASSTAAFTAQTLTTFPASPAAPPPTVKIVEPSNAAVVDATSPGCAMRPMARAGSPSRGSAASPTTLSGVAYARCAPPLTGTMTLRGPPKVGPSTVRTHVRVATSIVLNLNASSATRTVARPCCTRLWLSTMRGRKVSEVGTAPPPAAAPPSATSLTSSSFTPPSTELPKTSKRHRRPSSPHDTSSSVPSGPA